MEICHFRRPLFSRKHLRVYSTDHSKTKAFRMWRGRRLYTSYLARIIFLATWCFPRWEENVNLLGSERPEGFCLHSSVVYTGTLTIQKEWAANSGFRLRAASTGLLESACYTAFWILCLHGWCTLSQPSEILPKMPVSPSFAIFKVFPENDKRVTTNHNNHDSKDNAQTHL